MFKIFDEFINLKYGISLKTDEPMELMASGFSNSKNRNKFLKAQGLGSFKIIGPLQPHSSLASKVSLSDVGQVLGNVDGLATKEENLLLTVTVADCFPIYFYNPKTKTIGMVHSGWRGTVGNIAGATIKAMGDNAADVLVGIGPGIQACHFEIKEDIISQFSNYKKAIQYKEQKIFVDLPKIIKSQLLEAGVLESSVENLGECTYCYKDKYFSYRRDKPELVQPMIAYIGLA